MFTLLNKEISPHALAIHNTSPALVLYHDQVAEQETYWLERAAKSKDIADTAGQDMSTSLSYDLGNLLVAMDLIANGPPAQNRARMERAKSGTRGDVLGTLALSRLCRLLFPREGDEWGLDPDAIGGRIMLEPLYVGSDRQSIDRRMHIEPVILGEPIRGMPSVPEGRQSAWYEATDEYGKLFVHRTIEAKPSPKYASDLVMNEFNADMSGMHTLFPYIPRRP